MYFDKLIYKCKHKWILSTIRVRFEIAKYLAYKYLHFFIFSEQNTIFFVIMGVNFNVNSKQTYQYLKIIY